MPLTFRPDVLAGITCQKHETPVAEAALYGGT